MKTNNIIYWVTTGIVALMMSFSTYLYLTSPQLDAAFKHLGFPAYFRVELAIAKFLGAIILLAPQVPIRIKEWAYAGFGIVFISAIVAHTVSNDPLGTSVAPFVFLTLLIVSNVYHHKLKTRLA